MNVSVSTCRVNCQSSTAQALKRLRLTKWALEHCVFSLLSWVCVFGQFTQRPSLKLDTSPKHSMSFSGFRGGRRPWRGSSASQPSQGPIRTLPAPPLGALLQALTPEQCTKGEDNGPENVGITNSEFLASYNWTDAQDPTILFPGKFCRMKKVSPLLTEQTRHASSMGPSFRSEEVAARLRTILQRPECSEAPKPPHGTRSQSRAHAESESRHRDHRHIWVYKHAGQSFAIPQERRQDFPLYC
jgi:hypothetical protein